MCERCDAELGGLADAEIAHDAKGVAQIAAYILAEAIPNTAHGVVVAGAVGHALAKLTADMLALVPGEHMTPRMREYVKRIGDAAAVEIMDGYRSSPLIVGATR